MTAGICKLGNVAIRADQIKMIQNNGDSKGLTFIDTAGKTMALPGTRGEDFEAAIKTWQAALAGKDTTAATAKKKTAKKKAVKKKPPTAT